MARASAGADAASGRDGAAGGMTVKEVERTGWAGAEVCDRAPVTLVLKDGGHWWRIRMGKSGEYEREPGDAKGGSGTS